ncbi:MAG: glycosyltransferase [Bacteroidetes bacterium]|nr:MAG: glycosyltransferase [Bacteroidota bacterium]
MHKLSIVIPVYNSAPMLDPLFSGIMHELEGKAEYEVIFVDDGSRDGSWAEIEKLKAKHPARISGVRLSQNFGQHNALLCGFSFAKGDLVITMDDDMQHPPSEIPKLIAKFEETDADVVYGIPKHRRHGALRVAGSYFLRNTSKLAQDNRGEGSSFRLIRKSIIEQMEKHRHQNWVFVDEIIHWYTGYFASVDVEHHPRKEGKSGYSFRKLAAMYVNIIVNHSVVPLRLMILLGLLGSIFTFSLGIIFIYRKFAHQITVDGFTAQIVATLFSASILMLCMGIVGQYMYKLFQLQNQRPSYSIKKKI